MEYVDGPSLSERLRDGPLTPEEVVALRDRLASGLAEAHDIGICHRDLSPDNILLEHGRLGGAKLIDFGIAKLSDPDAQTVVGSAFAGKFSWASPEQVGLFGAQVDSRSDIYSLGPRARRRRPRPAARDGPVDDGGGQRPPDRPAARRRAAEPRPQIARMLAPDPLDRPQSMRELVTAASGPGPAPSAGTPRRRVAAIAALLGLVLVAAGAASGGNGARLRPRRLRRHYSSSRRWRHRGLPSRWCDRSRRGRSQRRRNRASAGAVGAGPRRRRSRPRPEPRAARTRPALDRQQLPRLLDLPPRDLYLAGRRFLQEKRDADTALVLWEEASRRGSGEAALGIARFYDPASWDQGPHPFTAPNPAKAREFYSTALERGMEDRPAAPPGPRQRRFRTMIRMAPPLRLAVGLAVWLSAALRRRRGDGADPPPHRPKPGRRC